MVAWIATRITRAAQERSAIDFKASWHFRCDGGWRKVAPSAWPTVEADAQLTEQRICLSH